MSELNNSSITIQVESIMKPNEQPFYNLTLLRHAQSIANENNILQGQLDSSLSSLGEEQSKSLAHLWKMESVSFDLVLTSPLQRAHRTAEIISDALDLEIEEDDLLMERKFGSAEGKSYQELQSLLRDQPSRSPYDPAFETGESDWDLFIRASKAIQRILQRPPGRYLLVSHGGLLNVAMHSILGMPPSSTGHRSIIRLQNTGYAVTEYNRLTDNWVVFNVNDTRHLAAVRMPKDV
jgi:2,3-bisphosphoglycerate-dependent phosphoglycerate mutase